MKIKRFSNSSLIAEAAPLLDAGIGGVGGLKYLAKKGLL